MASQSENINHFTGVRLRVVGAGNLKMNFYNLDNVRTTAFADLVMSANPGREPTKLCNFMHQRALLEGKTTEINDKFKINRIVIFVKPVFTSFPG